ncbi:MAG: hypothetical protein ACOC2F_01680 [Bacteroidota bacterium]
MKIRTLIILTLFNLNLTGQSLDFEFTLDLGMSIPLKKGIEQDGVFRFPLLYSNMKANSLEAMLLYRINQRFSAGIGIRGDIHHSWQADNSELYSGTTANILTLSPIIKYNFYRKGRSVFSIFTGISQNQIRLNFSESSTFFDNQNIEYLNYYENTTEIVYSPLVRLQYTHLFSKMHFVSSLTYKYLKLESPVYLDKGVNNLFFSAGFEYKFSITNTFVKKRFYLGE